MSFAPGEERTLAEKERSSLPGDFMLPDTLMCHRIYSRCIKRRAIQVVNDMFIPSSWSSQLIICYDGKWFRSFYMMVMKRSWLAGFYFRLQLQCFILIIGSKFTFNSLYIHLFIYRCVYIYIYILISEWVLWKIITNDADWMTEVGEGRF